MTAPTTRFAQTFGVEIECMLPAGKTRRQLADALNAAGVAASEEGYHHRTMSSWKVMIDGSLGYERGAEVVSPVLTGIEGAAQIKKVCDAMIAFGCKVNKQCGLHIHVGFRGASVDAIKRLAISYAHFERTIDAMMPPSRRGASNRYLQPMAPYRAAIGAARDLDTIIRAIPGRYFKLNLSSYWRHGTIEFRHHSGTVEADKILRWLDICLGLAFVARSEVSTPAWSMPIRPVATSRGVLPTAQSYPESFNMVKLMAREQGATEDELRTVTSLQRLGCKHRAEMFGYTYFKQTRGGVTRHYARLDGAPQQAPAGEPQARLLPLTASIHDLCAYAETSEQTRDYAVARAQRFAR